MKQRNNNNEKIIQENLYINYPIIENVIRLLFKISNYRNGSLVQHIENFGVQDKKENIPIIKANYLHDYLYSYCP